MIQNKLEHPEMIFEKMVCLGNACDLNDEHRPNFLKDMEEINNLKTYLNLSKEIKFLQGQYEMNEGYLFLNSEQHALIRLKSANTCNLEKMYSNDRKTKTIKEIKRPEMEPELRGVFSTQFSSCGLQLVVMETATESYLLVSHLQANTVLDQVLKLLSLSDENIFLIINVTLPQISSLLACYQGLDLEKLRERSLDIVRDDFIWDEEGILTGFALAACGVQIQEGNQLKLVFHGKPCSPFQWIAHSLFKGLPTLNCMGINTNYEDLFRDGKLGDRWSIQQNENQLKDIIYLAKSGKNNPIILNHKCPTITKAWRGFIDVNTIISHVKEFKNGKKTFIDLGKLHSSSKKNDKGCTVF